MSPNARGYINDEEIYHIISRGNNKMIFFHEDADFKFFLDLIK